MSGNVYLNESLKRAVQDIIDEIPEDLVENPENYNLVILVPRRLLVALIEANRRQNE